MRPRGRRSPASPDPPARPLCRRAAERQRRGFAALLEVHARQRAGRFEPLQAPCGDAIELRFGGLAGQHGAAPLQPERGIRPANAQQQHEAHEVQRAFDFARAEGVIAGDSAHHAAHIGAFRCQLRATLTLALLARLGFRLRAASLGLLVLVPGLPGLAGARSRRRPVRRLLRTDQPVDERIDLAAARRRNGERQLDELVHEAPTQRHRLYLVTLFRTVGVYC